MQMDFHTTMRKYTFTTILAALLYSLIAPTTSWAEVNTVPLSSITSNRSLQSKGIQISPPSLAAMMKQMRYKKEKLFGDIFSSEESKIDGIFTSGKSIEVFKSIEAQALSVEISAAANKLGSQQAIAFKSEMGRVKGYVFFSGQKSIWYFASIEGHPAHQTKKTEDESYMLDDPEADSRWNNRVEKSYWELRPQQSQSLYQSRPDWLRVPVKHIAATQAKIIAQPQRTALPTSNPIAAPSTAAIRTSTPTAAPRTAAVHTSTPTAAPRTAADAKRELRIERLHKLLRRELISSAEYDEKMISIIAEFNQSHPAIEAQLEFLKRLRDENKISQAIYQPRRQELLEQL